MSSVSAGTRIALFHPSLDTGGIQRVLVNLARGFVERGLAVDLVQATPGDEFRHAVPEGVRVIDFKARRALTSVWPLVRYLRTERPKCLISAAIQTNLVAAWARKLAGVPVRLVLTEHNVISTVSSDAPMFRTRITPLFVRRVYVSADELVAVSSGVAKDLAQVAGVDESSIHVIYNPVIGPDFYRRAAEPFKDDRLQHEKRPMVLAVGRLHYHKDYPTLLRAFTILRRTLDAVLVVLGDGDEREALQNLAHELGVADAVYFLGTVVNPLAYMRRAQVLALSSMVEALSSVLIEALGMNLPIVATDCPTSPREILCDGLYGRLVPVGNSDAIAEALGDVLQAGVRPSNPPEALSRFQEDKVVEQYIQLVNGGPEFRATTAPSISHEYSYSNTRTEG